MRGERAEELRRVAEQVAGEAAAFVRSRRTQLFGSARQPPEVRAKSTPTDPVTLADTETERLVRDRLAQLRPGEAILGEEHGQEQGEG
ncbi:MAG: inositol monophosphatase, partial [Mycobacterium sp.]|nr:inositol monophosphatase [Mycobacterium sp.]